MYCGNELANCYGSFVGSPTDTYLE